MVEIQVTRKGGYDDKQLNKHVNEGDKYIVDNERSEVILATGWAVKVRDIKEEVIETAKKEVKAEIAVKKPRKKTK